SMTELESLSFEGFPRLEAFQTSGGTSTLPDTFLGKVNDLDYKTIRFAGHCEKFKMMIDLGLCSSEPVSAGETAIKPRALSAELHAQNLPDDETYVVLVQLQFSGVKDGSPKKLRYD